MGLGWGNSILGFISLVFMPVLILLMKFGERLRQKMKDDNSAPRQDE